MEFFNRSETPAGGNTVIDANKNGSNGHSINGNTIFFDKFSLLLNSVSSAIVYVDKEQKLRYANKAFEKIFHVKAEDLHGKLVAEFLGEEANQVVKKYREQVLAGQTAHFEMEIPFRDENRYIDATFTPDKDNQGNVIGYILVINDISSESAAAKALKETEKKYKEVVDSLPVALYTCDTEGYITLSNKAADDLWGRQPELNKDKWCGSFKIFQPDGITPLPLDTCPMAVAVKEGRSVYGKEIIVERPDGSRRHVQPHPTPLFDTNGKISGAVNMLLDISDRKTAEKESAQLAAIVHSSYDAIISKTLNGIVTSWNEAAERLFGYTAKEMIGQPILRLIPADRLKEESTILERLKKGEKVEHFETKRIRKDKRILDLLLTISPVKDSSGNVIGASKIAKDITDMKRMEERKDDFIKMASHELKTPITSIKGYVQLLLSIYDDLSEEKFQASKGTVKSSLQTISKQVNKLTRLVSELLDLTRIESGRLELNKTTFNLADLIEETVQDVRLTTTRHAVIVHNEFEGNVHGDKDRISQVIMNLLTNAIKYSPDTDCVEIYAEKKGNKAILKVKDYGIGIDKKDHEKIFHRFFRVEGRSEQTYPGFGIGLFFAAEIIQRHNGIIFVRSEKGKGAEFIVELPVGI